LSLTGPDGLLKQFTKSVLESALYEEATRRSSNMGERVVGVHPVPGLRVAYVQES
jgi:hypothetical protein